MSANNNNIPRATKPTPNGYDNHAIDIEEPLFFPRDKPPKQRTAQEVVQTARNAFTSGRTRDVEYRRKQLRMLMRMLQENEDRFAEALKRDVRKHRQEGVAYDVEMTVNEVRGMLNHLDEYVGVEKPKKDLVNLLDGVFVYKDPYG